MGMTRIPFDFKEFLKLLREHDVRYLLVGGYAVGYHGYVRATGDMDIWVEPTAENAKKVLKVLAEFGFPASSLPPGTLEKHDQIIRMGIPPVRIELMSSISGVEFDSCFSKKVVDQIDGVIVNIIGREELKSNKKAAGRHKDLDDFEHL